MTSASHPLPNRRALLLAALAAAGARSVSAADAAAALPGTAAPAPTPAASVPSAPMQGTVEPLTIASRRTGITYPIRLYRPPGDRADAPIPLPLVYLLDAEWRLDPLARIAEAGGRRIRIAGIANEATRNHDDVPANGCIPGGGGHAEFFAFIVEELLPFVEARVAVDPKRRMLMGHSFGGALALYALFNEAPERHSFGAYLAADPGIRCIGDSAVAWEAGYAASTDRLPVRLHFSYANPASAPFAERVERRNYRGLRMATQAYAGGHDGMIPAAFADALAFALD